METEQPEGSSRVTRLTEALLSSFWIIISKYSEFYGYVEETDIRTIRTLADLYTEPGLDRSDWDPALNSLSAVCASAIILINMQARMEIGVKLDEQRESEGVQTDWADALRQLFEDLVPRLDEMQQGINDLLERTSEQLDLRDVYMAVNANTAAMDDLRLKLERIERTVGHFPLRQPDEEERFDQTTVCLKLHTLHSLLQSLPRGTADMVCSEIVGESYYRWDSSVRYFPTLILIFKDPLSEAPVRRTQTKFRATGCSNPPTSAEIAELQARCDQLLGNVSYVTGLVRCNYVSPHESGWKTTVFATSLEEAERVLTVGCAIVGETFVRGRLSYTQGRHPRVGLEAENPGFYDRRMVIAKAALLVNGASAPIVLYRSG